MTVAVIRVSFSVKINDMTLPQRGLNVQAYAERLVGEYPVQNKLPFFEQPRCG